MVPPFPIADSFLGVFFAGPEQAGLPSVVAAASAPASIPDPQTGRPLRIATVDGPTPAICPACAAAGRGGFISFEGDLRLAYACPACLRMVWLDGA